MQRTPACLGGIDAASHVQGQRTFGNDAQRGRKQDVVQNDLSALEMAHESAETELQKITSRNREVRGIRNSRGRQPPEHSSLVFVMLSLWACRS